MIVCENVAITHLTTLRLPAIANHLVSINDIDDLEQFVEREPYCTRPMMVLGGGSNLVFSDDWQGVVLRMGITGIEKTKEDDDSVWWRIGAGENWHQLVITALRSGLSGIENLALIPGTVGAAPIQNIGAYGVELSDVLSSVTVFDLSKRTCFELTGEACELGYRTSIFKTDCAADWVITHVSLRFKKQWCPKLSYGVLASTVEQGGDMSPSGVFNAVCKIRRSKLPDPESLPNVGSFFKNPIVNEQCLHGLLQSFPDIVYYELDQERAHRSMSESNNHNGLYFKLAAGWLIERCGLKGFREGNVGVFDQQALVLVNYTGTDKEDCQDAITGKRFLAFAEQVIQNVRDKFGVVLEIEPRIY